MAKRVARKIKRAGKVANQFSFTSTFEYIDLECKGSWRPDNLKVIWLRNHRRAQSINVEWICTDDRGPNGASGRAVFDPPISATLIVTLYKDSKQSKRFEEKEYKYYIENEGSSGKKILASFTCDMAEYAEIPSSRHALEMNFKPISTKVRKCHLGVTLESRFTKEGNPNDDDMQSTFSADVGGEDNKLVFADEDEEEIDEDDLDEAATLGQKVIANMTSDQKDKEVSVIMLGTGQTLKRSDINTQEPPKKPPRTSSIMNILDDEEQGDDNCDESKSSLNEIVNEQSTVDCNTNQSDHTQTDNKQMATTDDTLTDHSNDTVVHSDVNPQHDECSNSTPADQSESDTTTAFQSADSNSQSDSNIQSATTNQSADLNATTAKLNDMMQQSDSNITTTQNTCTTVAQTDSNTTVLSNPDSKTAVVQPVSNNGSRTEPDLTPDDSTTADNTSTGQEDDTTTTEPPPVDNTTETEETATSTEATTTDTTATGTDDVPEASKEAIDQVQSWLSGIELIDSGDKPVDIARLASADIIAFYFSASWCPPCKTFLPHLKKFYNGLKENNKSFELVYVSSDYSREEMVAYMSESTMPWTAIRYGHKLADSLRQDYSIRVIPILVVTSRSGVLIDENAKKQVDKAAAVSSAASCIQLYNKWVEKLNNPEASVTSVDEPKSKKATVKKQATKDEDTPTTSITNEELREATESKTPKSLINTGGNKDELVRQLQEKENIIRQLEEVNLSLKHTNDDLNTEVRNLKSRIELLNDELKSIKETDEKQKKDEEMFQEYLKLQGWLFKRGIKGPTANKWRRRYFRLDQGSKLYYYKNHTEGTPQGHIDLLKIIEVKELTAAQQDKNNASFNIVCEGRTFQLQAYDEVEMRRWITAIGKVKEFYLKQSNE